MTLSAYNQMEDGILANLQERAYNGDNGAAATALAHIVNAKRQIGDWQIAKDKEKRKAARDGGVE